MNESPHSLIDLFFTIKAFYVPPFVLISMPRSVKEVSFHGKRTIKKVYTIGFEPQTCKSFRNNHLSISTKPVLDGIHEKS